MPDFTKLLGKSAGQAKKPPVLEIGDYGAIITSHEMGESQNKKTPYVQYNVTLTEWPEGNAQTDEDGKAIDLSKRKMNVKFFLTEEALFRLDEFLRSLGINLNDKSYAEAIPEAEGMNVVAEVSQYMNQNTNEFANQINRLRAPD